MDDTRKFLEYLATPSTWSKQYPMGDIPQKPVIDMNEVLEHRAKQRQTGSMLPPIIRGSDFPPQYELEHRPPLVEGLFRAKDNVLLGAPPKMGKTWFFSTLACSLASGRHFCDLETKQSKVLLIDLELHKDDCLDRIWSIAVSQGMKKPPEDLWVWCLREYEYDLEVLLAELDSRVDEMGGVDVIILDPLYMLGDAEFDENNAQSVKHFLKGIAMLKNKNNSALLLAHHFSKGNKGRESHSDRISGSGSFQRFPDSLITLTPHKVDKHAIMEVTGRSMPNFPPMVLNMTPPTIMATDLNVEFK